MFWGCECVFRSVWPSYAWKKASEGAERKGEICNFRAPDVMVRTGPIPCLPSANLNFYS